MSEERRERGKGTFALDRFLQSETGKKAQPFIVAALLMFCFVNFPSQPITTGTESWSHVMLLAREHGLRFGHDVIYTYGPAAFLFMAYFPEHTPVIRLICDVAGAYTVALG